MKYMGSKNRISKDILPIILKGREKDQFYVEPFVGGGNLIDKVTGNRMGADVNESVISALRLIRDWAPSLPMTNSDFKECDYKNRAENFNWMKGFAAFAYSYSGKFWGGWCRDGAGKRDYVNEAYKNAIKQQPKLYGVDFINCPYNELDIPENSIIYCDPPYKGATKYKHDFDHDSFWGWCRDMSANGHTVFISEYNAPDDFECVWEKAIVSSLTKNTGSKKGTEKLFIPITARPVD